MMKTLGCVLFVLVLSLSSVLANYPCLCFYEMETAVFKDADEFSANLGYMYEFDCLPTYPQANLADRSYLAVQYRNQVGYVKNPGGSQIYVESCPGPLPANNKVTTTQAPITQAPTTQAPTTQAPTTQAPTTQAPTTQAPTTQAPTTQAPTTQAPSTEASTTLAPSTQAPTTQAPTTQAPTTQAPSTEAPTTLAPSTEAPTTLAPITAVTASEVPITQAPTVVPTTQAPITQAPTVVPTTQAPITEAPTTQIPTSRSPTTQIPTVPTSNVPDTTAVITTGKPVQTTVTDEPPTHTVPVTTTMKPVVTTTHIQTTVPTTPDINLPSCPDGWLQKTASCYLFLFKMPRSRKEAEQACLRHNAHLVIIDSQIEQDTLAEYITNYYDKDNSTQQHLYAKFWTGGMKPSGVTHWNIFNPITHSITNMKYSNWTPGEFPDIVSPTTDRCALINRGDNYQWIIRDCETPFYTICENAVFSLQSQTQFTVAPTVLSTQTSSVQSISTVPNTGICPTGWIKSHISCYLFLLENSLTQAEAQARCLQDKAHLVIIDSQFEQETITNKLTDLYKTKPLFGVMFDKIWTGGILHPDEMSWRWVDPVSNSNLTMRYTYWAAKQTLLGGDIMTDRCAVLSRSANFAWNSVDCTTHYYTVCEKSTFVNPGASFLG